MKADPLKWAAIGCIGCAMIAAIAQVSGNPMPSAPVAAASAGLFWGYVLALIRNRGLN